MHSRFDPPISFTDHRALRGTGVVCGFCEAARDQRVMRKLQRCVVTSDGCFPIGSDDNRAWLLLDPPPPPFGVVVNAASMTAAFHLFWRTPLTLDRDLLIVNVDNRVMPVRRKVMLEAIGWCRDLAAAVNAARTPARRRPDMKHPFRRLDRSPFGGADGHGVLLEEAHRLGAAGEFAPLVRNLKSLWAGELWALATLVKSKPVTPIRPDPITSIEASTTVED